jgi:hypothetical protein
METIIDDVSGEEIEVSRVGSNGETGDKELIHCRTPFGVGVIITNGNQIWEDDDGFADAVAECDEI